MRRKRLIVWAVLMACSVTARAQWTQTAGPEGAVAQGIAADGERLVAVIDNQIHHLDATGWSRVGSLGEFDGLHAPLGGATLMLDSRMLLANTRDGIVSSTDGGRSWTGTGMQGAIFEMGGEAAIMSEGVVYQSKDGATWRPVATLPSLASIPVLFNDALYVTQGYEQRLRRTRDNGVTWEEVATDGMPIGSGTILAAGADALYAAWGRTIFRSEDGTHWSDISGDLPEWLVIERIVPGKELMITTNMGFHRLEGASWQKIDMAAVTAIDATSDGAVVATRAGIFRVDNRSDRATSLNKGLIRGNAGMLGAIGETVFTNTSNGIYRSTDHGEHWMQVSDFSGWGFTRDGNDLYTSSGIAYRSSDSGATWTPTGPLFGFDWDGPPQRNDVTSIAAADGAVYIGVARYLTDKGANGGWASGGIYRSTDDGATWQEMNNGLPHGAGGVPAPINGIIATRDHILIATAAGIYRSTDRGARWVPSMTGLPAGDRYMGAGELTAGVSATYLRLGTGHFESTDGGLSWQPLSTPLPDGFGWSSGYSVVDDRIYMRSYRSNGANGFDERLFMLKDRSWEDISATQPENVRIESIIRAGRYLYAGTRSDGVWTQQTGGALPSSVAFGSAAHRSGALEIFPNPSADQTEIRCTLSAPGRLRITLTSMLGEEVAAFDGGTSDAGTRSIRIDTRGIAAGVYLIHVRAGDETHEGRVVIGR